MTPTRVNLLQARDVLGIRGVAPTMVLDERARTRRDLPRAPVGHAADDDDVGGQAERRRDVGGEPAQHRGGAHEGREQTVEDEQLWLGVEGMRKQHSTQFTAREHGERTPFATRESDPREQIRNAGSCGPPDAEADRHPLPGEREKVFNRHRQRRVVQPTRDPVRT